MPFKPILAVLEITDECNLQCKHCSNIPNNPKSRLLLLREWKIIINKLVKSGCEMISLTGGEPLMHPDFFNILKHCKKAGLHVTVTSNGYFISRNIAKELSRSKVDRVQISIDGVKKVHEKIRGKGSFDKATRAIENLLSANVVTNTMTILSRFNKDTMELFVKHIFSFGIDHMCFERLTPVGHGITLKSHMLTPVELKDVFKQIYALRKKYNLRINDPLCALVDKEILAFSMDKDFPCGGCLAGIFSCVIASNGDLKLCTRLPHRLGNLQKKPLSSIWDTSITQKLRNRDLEGECKECRNKYICGGCRAESYSHSGNIFDFDPGCWYKEKELNK